MLVHHQYHQSKAWVTHLWPMGLNFAHYNFCRQHHSICLCSPVQPPCIAGLPGEGHNPASSGLPAADVVPLVQQQALEAGPQASGPLALSKAGPAMLGTEGAQHSHHHEGSQHRLDGKGQRTSPQVRVLHNANAESEFSWQQLAGDEYV